MSIRRKHSVYIARNGLSGCGHQHDNEIAAINCAANEMRAHPDIVDMDIVEVARRHRTGGITEKTINVVRRANA